MENIVYSSPRKTMRIEEGYSSVRGKKLRNFRILKNDAVVILPFLDEDTIIMERQFRFAVKRKILELPAGSIEKNESRENAVKRELAEEVGYYPRKLKLMFKTWNNPAIMDYVEYHYLAYNLVKKKGSPDETELITPVKIKFDEAVSSAYTGGIMDTKSMLSLLFYLQRYRRKDK